MLHKPPNGRPLGIPVTYLSLGSLLRDHSCHQARWKAQQVQDEEAKEGSASWALDARCQSLDQGEGTSISARYVSLHLDGYTFWLGNCHRLYSCVSARISKLVAVRKVANVPNSIGDAIDAFFALLVLKTCLKVEDGLPNALKVRMLFNIFLDFIVGLIPFLGDVVDAIFRCNTRNAILLEEHLREKGRKNLRDAGQPIPSADPSDPVEFDRRESNLPSSRQPSPNPSRRPSTSQRPPRQPEPAATRESGGGWFGRKKQRPSDVEMANVENSRSDSRRTPQRHSSRR